MLPTEPPPSSLVTADGRVRMGVFSGPLANPDLHRARLVRGGVAMPAAWSRLRLKEWEHTLLLLPGELLLTVAVVDAKFLGSTWVHVADLAGGTHLEHARQGPLLEREVGLSQLRGSTWARARGYRLELENRLEEGRHAVQIEVETAGELPPVSAALLMRHDLDAIQPLVVCLPVGPNRGQYSHKVALPLEGVIRVGERTWQADPATARAILDVHKAHYPRDTWWNWSTGVGRLADGREVAFNLTRNLNRRDDEINENAVWVDGILERLGPARFHHGPDVLEPWRVGTADGAVGLEFTPSGERSADLDMGAVVSRFHQPYGRYTGAITFQGEVLEVVEAWGVCEDHTARW